MIPIVALVGRSNVGKSTLFNRLTRTCNAIVANFPGLTRDRHYGYAEIEGHEFICIDTGGINGMRDSMAARIAEQQSLLAIKEADIILFMVDARVGLVPIDSIIAKYLRSYKKQIFLVANKIDSVDVRQTSTDFWPLGFGKIYPISASHGRGVTNLLKGMLSSFSKEVNLLQKDVNKDAIYWKKLWENKNNLDSRYRNYFDLQKSPIKLAIVGRPNVGKSTLTNSLLGKERVVVCDIPGTTRDSIYIPMQRNNQEYVLIDTAGVRKRSKIVDFVEKSSVIKTLQAIEDANVVLLIIDARESISDQDLSLLHFILKRGRSLIIVVNKCDNLKNKEKEKIKETLNYRLSFIKFARVHFISALYGNNLGRLFKSVREAYDNSIRHQSSAILTNIMNMAVENHQPPLIRGRRVKLKYIHSGGYNPLVLVIHGNQVKRLPHSYKRYLINYFHKSLEVVGAPILLQFKEGENPFARKKSTLKLN